jgi:hypothetical protein
MDVYTFSPFGIGLFLQCDVPSKIKKSDIIRVVDVPSAPYCQCLSDSSSSLGHGSCNPYGGIVNDSASSFESFSEPEIIEVSPRVYSEFLTLKDTHNRKFESLWKRLYTRRR